MDHKVDKDFVKSLLFTFLKLALLFVVVLFLLSMMSQDGQSLHSFSVLTAFTFLSIVYGANFVFQLRSIKRARYPGIRVTEAMISTAFLFLAMFASLYNVISAGDPGAFTEVMTPFTGLYVAITILSTVGFGDITPVSTMARSVVMIQMTLGLIYLGLGIKFLAGAARGRGRQVKSGDYSGLSDPQA